MTAMPSILAEKRNDGAQNYVDDKTGADWRFMTVRNWGESSQGTWRLIVSDPAANDTGVFHSWELIMHGSANGGNDIFLPMIVNGS